MKPQYGGNDPRIKHLINDARSIRFIDDRLDELEPKKRARVEEVMFKYGNNKWWRSTNQRVFTRYQIQEPDTLMFLERDGLEDGTLYARGLRAIFGRDTDHHSIPGVCLVEVGDREFVDPVTISLIADEARKLLGNQEQKESISESLLRLGFAEKHLSDVMRAMDTMKANNVAITTETSLSDVVFDFKATMREGKGNASYHVYAKIAPTSVLEREIAYLERASKYAVLRPVSSQVVAYTKSGNDGLLITLDVNENHRKLSSGDFAAYFKLKEQALQSFSRSMGISYSHALADTIIEDFFNAALHAVYMNIDPDKSQFEKVVLGAVPSADVVDRWFSNGRANNAAVSKLKHLLPAYHAIVPELSEQSQSGNRIIVDTDRNPRNIIRDRYSGINVMIDPGFSGINRVEFMLASIGHPDADFATNAFNYFAGYIADKDKIGFSAFANADLVRKATAGKDFRMAASYASRGEENHHYIQRAGALGRYL